MYEGRIINHTHEDGRACILGPDGLWRHWDNDGVIPGPRDSVDWKCDRVHPCAEAREVTVTDEIVQSNPIIDPVDNREDYRDEEADRGEFGMPTIGVRLDEAGHRLLTEMREASMGDNTVDDETLAAFKLGPGMILQMETGPISPKAYGIMAGIPFKCTITEDEVSVNYGELGHGMHAATDDAKYILNIVPELLIKFLEKNAKYAGAQALNLGAKGIVPDLNRKVAAIKTRVWDEAEAGSQESTEEILEDLIGHALLMLAQLRHG